MNYQGVTLLGGKLCTPYVALATFPEGIGPEQVDVTIIGAPFVLEGALAEHRTKLDRQREIERMAGKTVPFNGVKARVTNYSVNEGNNHFGLVLQKVDFYDHLASNKALDTPLEALDGKTPRDFYNLDVHDMDHVLANPAGVNGALLSSDDHLVVIHRSPKIEQYPNLFGIPAGFMDLLKADYYPKDVTPFHTIARDAALEETGRPLMETKLFELGRALDDLHFEIGMIGVIDGTKAQIQSAPKAGEWEAKGRYFVPFNPTDCAKYMTETITEIPPKVPEKFWMIGKSPKWVPAHHRIVYLALVNKYGQDEVDKELEKALA